MISVPTASVRTRQAYLPLDRGDGPGDRMIASSTAWAGLGIGATSVLQIVRSMIFARLLMPEDFGILSLANVFTQFILIFANFGFNQSVIYHQDLDRQDLSTCWWANVGIDTVTALICIVAAQVSAGFTGDRIMANVICLLALQFITTSFGSINNSLMRRAFMFRELAISNFAGAVISFATAWTLVAAAGWGVYGLVTGLIAGNVIMVCLNFLFLPWLPSFTFSREALKRHLRYGRWLLGVSLVTFANGSLDRVTIGALLNKTQLGFYEYASNIPLMLVNMLARVLNSVLFSAFSSLQDDPKALQRLLANVYRYNAMLVYPLLSGIALVAPEFIMVAYGAKWLPILVPLRIFCAVGILQMYTQPLYILCNGIGEPAMPFRWSLTYLPINLILLVIGVKLGGTMGAVTARLVMPLFMMATLGTQVMRRIDVRWSRLYRATGPAFAASAAMVLAIGGLRRFGPVLPDETILRLAVLVATGAAVYGLVMVVFFRGELTGLAKFLRRSD